MGHEETFILLQIHVEMLETMKTTLLRQTDQFWSFLEKCQQVGLKIAVQT